VGVKEKDRKDGKLERVIINEKTVKKVCFPVLFGSVEKEQTTNQP